MHQERTFELEVKIQITPTELRNIASMLEEEGIEKVNYNWYKTRYTFVNKNKPCTKKST